MELRIALRVRVPKLDVTKTCRFRAKSTALEVLETLREKIGSLPFEDPVVMLAEKAGVRPRQLMKPMDTLAATDLLNGDELVVVPKRWPLGIELMDGHRRMVLVEWDMSLDDLISHIGAKLGLSNVEEFGVKKDTESKWLNGAQTVFEHGLNPCDRVLFKKRFLIETGGVDKSDHVQLHLVYAQSKTCILEGAYPCSAEQCCDFAALQLLIEDEEEVDVKRVLPPYALHMPLRSVVGQKTATTLFLSWKAATSSSCLSWLCHDLIRLLCEHVIVACRPLEFPLCIARRRDVYHGITTLNAKFRYVQMTRQLSTYGLTCFHVSRKKNDRKKLEKCLMGISRDSVLILDATTKKVEKEWPLRLIKRWAAAKTSFTIDFGSYEPDYLTVATNEAEQMSQLLSGYIDILLRRQQENQIMQDEGDIAEIEELGPLVAVPNIATRVYIKSN